jgi:hypothetical protein
MSMDKVLFLEAVVHFYGYSYAPYKTLHADRGVVSTD